MPGRNIECNIERDLDPGNVYFVLVRPVYLGNIGSVARLIKNFGFAKLRLVEPPRNYKDAEARKMSVGAFDVLKNCTVFDNLRDSIKDMNLVVGTSAGQQRAHSFAPFDETLNQIRASHPNKVALVFGDERNGLSNEELAQCTAVISIPAHPAFPSLNVSHAACILAYEISRAISWEVPASCSLGTVNSDQLLTSVDEDDELFMQLAILLDRIEFSRTFSKTQILTELRQFYRRAMPNQREGALLRGVLHKLNQTMIAKNEPVV